MKKGLSYYISAILIGGLTIFTALRFIFGVSEEGSIYYAILVVINEFFNRIFLRLFWLIKHNMAFGKPSLKELAKRFVPYLLSMLIVGSTIFCFFHFVLPVSTAVSITFAVICMSAELGGRGLIGLYRQIMLPK